MTYSVRSGAKHPTDVGDFGSYSNPCWNMMSLAEGTKVDTLNVDCTPAVAGRSSLVPVVGDE